MVPSIYSIDPTEGLASGRQRVKLIGNFFRLPSTPDASAPTDGSRGPSVQVQVDGRDADAVAVLDEQTIVIVTPEYLGHPSNLPAAVDVVAQNVDDDGVPIPGESYTLGDGFTYKREDTTAESGITWMTRCLLRTLRRNIVDNVAVSASPDWTGAPSQIVAAVGDLPVVLLEGPAIERNKFYSYSDTSESEYEGGDVEGAHPFTCDLTWDIILVARRKVEAMNLCDVALRYFRRRPLFAFPTGPADPTVLEARIFFEDWQAVDRLPDQVFMYESSIKIEGIQLDDVDGMPTDADIAYEVDDFELTFVEMEV